MSSIAAQLKQIVAQILDMDEADVVDDLCAKTCAEWDSARHVNIILAIEDKFDIAFEEEDFVKMNNFAALVALVSQKLA